jgi:hypothetical protein
MLSALSHVLDTTEFNSLTLYRIGNEWQANLQVESGGGWRVSHGATPSEAIAMLFEPVPVFAPSLAPPPPPY